MVAPWLVIYLLFQLGLLVALPLTWGSLGPLRAVTIATLAIVCYCYTVVTFYFNELKEEDEDKDEDERDVELAVSDSRRRRQAEDGPEVRAKAKAKAADSNGSALIVLEEDTAAGVAEASADDTFTQLVYRKDKPRSGTEDDGSGSFTVPLSDSNPFASMIQAAEAGDDFKASFLPKPEEVIQVAGAKRPHQGEEAGAEDIPEETLGLLGGEEDDEEATPPFSNTRLVLNPEGPPPSITKSGQLQLRRQRSDADATGSTSSSSIPGGPRSSHDITDGTGADSRLQRRSRGHSSNALAAEQLQQSGSGEEARSTSHSGLVDIDSSFTPFKKKGAASGGAELPKMKIFLPQQGDTSSDNEDDTSSEEGEGK